jgi:hypothetical protein
LTEGDFTVAVEADQDLSGEALPRRLHLGGHVVEVAEIVDRWPGAGHLYVKLRGTDGNIYILRQDLDHVAWQLVLFRDQRAEHPIG